MKGAEVRKRKKKPGYNQFYSISTPIYHLKK
jgi:hypothetical protein